MAGLFDRPPPPPGLFDGRAEARQRAAAQVQAPGFAAFDQALKQYPVLGNMGLSFASSPGKQGGGMLEYWPPDETGSPDYPRPTGIPMGKTGIEAIDPAMQPVDVLGDVVSHGLAESDPKIKGYYDRFVSSLTPKQEGILREQYDWARQNEGEQRPFKQWAQMTGLPGYFRGYAFKQWPDEASAEMYTPEQLSMFDEMMSSLQSSGRP